MIPRLYPFCSGRVTAMERIDGHKVTEPGELDLWDRRRLAELIVEAMIAGPIWSPASRATFHADPHAGNLFVTPDRRLAILDWSLTGTLGESERIAMTQLVLGGLSLSAGQIRSGLLDLALEQRVDEVALDDVIQDWLRRIRQGMFPGFSWLMGMLDDAVLRARLRAGTDLIMFRKVRPDPGRCPRRRLGAGPRRRASALTIPSETGLRVAATAAHSAPFAPSRPACRTRTSPC